uniref:Uncharacterized protein n=1 Tax=Arundo donax TaxID=35708 RepID=A0A0A9FVL2_ARUDO
MHQVFCSCTSFLNKHTPNSFVMETGNIYQVFYSGSHILTFLFVGLHERNNAAHRHYINYLKSILLARYFQCIFFC